MRYYPLNDFCLEKYILSYIKDVYYINRNKMYYILVYKYYNTSTHNVYSNITKLHFTLNNIVVFI